MITPRDYARPASAGGDARALVGRTLGEAVDDVRGRIPDRIAVLDEGVRLTWSELWRRSTNLCRALGAAGVGRGDPVGIQMPNGWQFMATHLALARIGAVTATVHQPYGPSERVRMMEQIRAKAVVQLATEPGAGGRIVLAEPSGEAWRELRWAGDPPAALGEPGPEACDPLSIFFTSGTETPRPKACLHSHDGLVSNALWVASDAPVASDDVILSGSAFSHLFGTLALHLSLVTGARQVALARFDPSRLLRVCADEAVTVLFLVPAHLIDLLRAVREQGLPGELRLREIRVAGAHVPPGLVQQVRDALGAAVVVHWGMSELGGGIYTHQLDPVEVAQSTIGRPTHGSSALVVDDAFRPLRSEGEVGELLFRGPSLFHGYLGAEELTRAAYVEVEGAHWFRTGDLASVAKEGRIRYEGRKKDLINRGGMKVSAQEVESAVARMPGVRAVALVAEPDPRLGERGCLFMQCEPAATVALPDVQRHLEAEGLARFKWPERVIVVDALPLTATGKVSKGQLREGLAGATSA